LFTPTGKGLCQLLSKTRAKRENYGLSTPYRRDAFQEFAKSAASRGKVGNLHRMLQARYCSATLILDEWMQIYYGPPLAIDERMPKELPVR